MSYRKQDGVDELAGCLGLLMFGVIGAVIGALFQSTKVPPEAKLRELDPPSYWAYPLESLPCPNCQTINESNDIVCFVCGSNLQGDSQPSQGNNQMPAGTAISIFFQ